MVIQGQQTALAQTVQQWKQSGLTPGNPVTPANKEGDEPLHLTSGAGPSKDVFIVYGHDEDARDKLELLLRRMGLNPIVLMNLPAGGDTIIEKRELPRRPQQRWIRVCSPDPGTTRGSQSAATRTANIALARTSSSNRHGPRPARPKACRELT